MTSSFTCLGRKLGGKTGGTRLNDYDGEKLIAEWSVIIICLGDLNVIYLEVTKGLVIKVHMWWKTYCHNHDRDQSTELAYNN